MKILFLGDSITDCNHNFTPDCLGEGYVKIFSQDHPGTEIINGGSDGFTFPRTLEKWRRTYASAHCDCAVITGGVNEAGVVMNTCLQPEQASLFLDRSQTALHDLLSGLISRSTRRIVLVEPFLFPTPQYRLSWMPTLYEVRRRIRETASGFSSDTVLCISVQKQLEELARVHDAISYEAVTTDGIHLTEAGHRSLAGAVASVLFRPLPPLSVF